MRDVDVFTLADRAAHRRPLPPCEADTCSECDPHDPHEPGECNDAGYDRYGLPGPCRCIGTDPPRH